MAVRDAGFGCVAVVLVFALGAAFPAYAQGLSAFSDYESVSNVTTSVPRQMTYQGILKDSGGDPVTDSVYGVAFRIYDLETGGIALWEQTLPCTTSNGLFNVVFSSVNLPFDEDYWLELEVGGEILTPRPKISMAGYSARSDTSDYAFVGGGWVDDGFNVRLQAAYDKVGIGTSSPTNKLHVTGSESMPILNVEQYGSARAARFYSQNVCALWVEHSGNHGLRVTNANGNGVYIQNAGNDGIRVDNAGGWGGYFNGKGYFADSLGVGTTSPSERVDVNGTTRMTGFKLPTGAAEGYVLTSDASGTGSWQSAPGGDSDWIISDTNMYSGVPGNVGVGTSTPDEKLEINGNILVDGKATIGASNTNTGVDAFVAGRYNYSSDTATVVSGGRDNTASGRLSSIGGGQENTATHPYSRVGGGIFNEALADGAVVSGGYSNVASGGRSVVAGGQSDTANGYYSSVGGGYNNKAGSDYATIAGGQSNRAVGYNSVVSGGITNSANGDRAVVSGGEGNTAGSQFSIIGGGDANTASGDHSVVLGGSNNTVSSMYSLAFGQNVSVSDYRAVAFYESSLAGKLGINRDSDDGGIFNPIHVGTNTGNGNGAYLTWGGVWTNGSSRTFKENGKPVTGPELLDKISNLQIDHFNFINSNETHICPNAEDFVATFDVGAIRESDGKRDDQYLAASDVAGVALAGVQELNKKLERENQEMRKMINELRAEIIKLKAKSK